MIFNVKTIKLSAFIQNKILGSITKLSTIIRSTASSLLVTHTSTAVYSKQCPLLSTVSASPPGHNQSCTFSNFNGSLFYARHADCYYTSKVCRSIISSSLRSFNF
jgi:hypothetical protein